MKKQFHEKTVSELMWLYILIEDILYCNSPRTLRTSHTYTLKTKHHKFLLHTLTSNYCTILT